MHHSSLFVSPSFGGMCPEENSRAYGVEATSRPCSALYLGLCSPSKACWLQTGLRDKGLNIDGGCVDAAIQVQITAGW